MRYKGCPSPENPACASSHIDVRHYGKNWDNAGLSTSELVELAGDNTIEVFASGYLCSNCVRAVRLALTWDGEKYDANDETIIPNLNNDESARSEERRAYDMHQMSALRVHCVSREQFYASVREQCRVCVQIASTAALDQVSLEISFRPFTGYNIELDDKKEMSIEFFFGTSTHEVARFFTFKVQGK
ncbi:hypothetical protein K432DRAFT_408779 [Lepidopterella palustris CBS 459.81]|uniref:Uncharacterized protein n=1 Tax=Lepidopterella palustris CBS 459.81 TaxID=1314670 RepID=A0A8E2E211_9PEZI|nr:hypothetical protein K432DRAFT_408779 [Lepidopterella palustris CBS 459.81]